MSDQIFASFHPDPSPKSYISLTNLTISPGVLAPDIWTHTSPSNTPYKLQTATLSLHLQLASSRSPEGATGATKEPTTAWSAAEKDALDDTTVHYGILAKALRRVLAGGEGQGVEFERVFGVVGEVLETGGKGAVEKAVVEVRLPKAGMWTDSGLAVRVEGNRWVVVVEGMRVMTLVGVNANERRARQPVVVSVWVYFEREEGVALRDVIAVEQVLAEIIEETGFETLESLAEFAVEEVQERLLRRVLKGGWVQLRLEKPRAVGFAEAPAIEVLRRIEDKGRQAPKVELAVVKPYLT